MDKVYAYFDCFMMKTEEWRNNKKKYFIQPC